MARIATVAPITAASDSSTTAIAWRCTERASRLPKMFTAVPPRSSVTRMKNSTANVVTLMPPAVPPGPPPMNISTSMISHVSSCMAPTSMELKPAVLVCTEWNSAASTRVQPLSAPRVRGLFHSITAIASHPISSSAAVTGSTIRVFIDQCSGLRHSRASSRSTGKPSPPSTIAAHIGNVIHGSATKRTMLSLYSAKPALLKADTEWKTPCHTAFGASYP